MSRVRTAGRALPGAVAICDVGPRDGLQNEPVSLPPAVRAELCLRLADAGVRRCEAASFVRAGRVPQMAGAEDVFARLPPDGGTRWVALVLNRRGLDRALAAGAREIDYAVMATDLFSQANCNMSVEAALSDAAQLVAAAHARGAAVTTTISVAFGCPFAGRVDPGRVVAIAERLAAAGADAIVLADTIGVAVPHEVAALVGRVAAAHPAVGAHLHNTRNTGYANALAALEAGASTLESSVGGLGGCPFAPAATGNIATEDLVHMLEREGVETGVDLDRTIAVARWLRDRLGHPLPGMLHVAGRFPPTAADGRTGTDRRAEEIPASVTEEESR